MSMTCDIDDLSNTRHRYLCQICMRFKPLTIQPRHGPGCQRSRQRGFGHRQTKRERYTLACELSLRAQRSQVEGHQQSIWHGCKREIKTLESCIDGCSTHLLSRSKILIELAVAAQSQYRLGENTRALTTSPASSEYRCLPSLRSQSIVIPSLPPDAASEPSGDTARVLMYPV